MASESFTRFKDALRYALLNYESPNGKKGKNVEKGQALKHLALDLIDMAINAKDHQRIVIIKELIDRLDGKPMQSIGGHDGEQLTVIHRVIQHKEGEKVIDVTPVKASEPPKPLEIQ